VIARLADLNDYEFESKVDHLHTLAVIAVVVELQKVNVLESHEICELNELC
jgi:hypothetical protein